MNGMTRRAALALSRCLGRPVVVVNRWDRFDVALPDGDTRFWESLAEVNGDLYGSGYECFRLVLLSGAQSDELVTEPVAEGTEATGNLEGTDSANPDTPEGDGPYIAWK
ncbi:hypothetical protein [Armatimonas sp.]|uniref:hypothetical protein n=1 Tax=Armatimonas sp. TaxID=1872638 RepID=UPI00286CD1FE|nr:hypothetical protein [Armatimonas sp.]